MGLEPVEFPFQLLGEAARQFAVFSRYVNLFSAMPEGFCAFIA